MSGAGFGQLPISATWLNDISQMGSGYASNSQQAAGQYDPARINMDAARALQNKQDARFTPPSGAAALAAVYATRARIAEETDKLRQPRHRTQAEIIAQLEARYAEMEAEANSPAKLYPCKTCRFASGPWCRNALITGIGNKDVTHNDEYAGYANSLCGPEKALWEPRPPSLWRRFMNWIAALFEGIN